MSMKDRLTKKTQDLVVPAKGNSGAVAPNVNPMRTGPGQMLMVNSLMRESNEKVASLEERLKHFDRALPVLLLDAALIVASRWANRVDASFDHPDFERLKAEISSAGGNVQPIKVRPAVDLGTQYEIIFGHRRHRACMELGLPVLAVVEPLSDAELFKQMDRENRARSDLSPWEQGRMYRQALDERLFTSREQLARELGIDAGNLSKALRLADLDEAVVLAFASPLELQYRWAKPLADALLEDRGRVLAIAQELAATPASVREARVVFERLIGAVAKDVRIDHVRVGRRLVADIEVERERVTVRFASGAISQSALERLREFIQSEAIGKSGDV